jgi:two-component system, chemotaxis family, response regulator WspF
VKIGIVNDMRMAIEAQRRVLALRPMHEIVWVATNGADAIQLCARHTPDLVLMDLVMPGLDGVAATRRIMDESPCAILIVTSSVGANTARVFEAMGYGAMDALDTPDGDRSPGTEAFLKKIDIMERLIGTRKFDPCRDSLGDTGVILRRERLVVIGASAGGPAALATLLGGLPPDFPAGIVIVQHVDEQFARSMAEWLSRHCRLSVRVALENDRPEAGTALLAATNEHLRFKSTTRVGYTVEPREAIYRPSIDVSLNSVCEHWRGEAIGVLLTGMGRDGAEGLKAMRNHGHYTIAQDSLTSAVYGMPKAAAALGAAIDVLPLNRIAPRLLDVVMYGAFAKA